MARERGLSVDLDGFHALMKRQKDMAQAAQKKQVIELSEIETKTPTHFLGYEHNHTGADVQEVLSVKGKTVVVANNSVCYAEMGGQVGDSGEMIGKGGNAWRIRQYAKERKHVAALSGGERGPGRRRSRHHPVRRPAPRGHPAASHGDASAALGVARGGEQGGDAERLVGGAGQADV
jgi:alanyl-tRNA synthetase